VVNACRNTQYQRRARRASGHTAFAITLHARPIYGSPPRRARQLWETLSAQPASADCTARFISGGIATRQFELLRRSSFGDQRGGQARALADLDDIDDDVRGSVTIGTSLRS